MGGHTWIFFFGIAIGLVALAAWVTHCIWFFRSFGSGSVLSKESRAIIRNNGLRYYLGIMGLMIPIIGAGHGLAIWAGVGARVK